MRRVALALTAILTVVPIAGCGPQLTREELGEVVFELPKVEPQQPAGEEAEKQEPAPSP